MAWLKVTTRKGKTSYVPLSARKAIRESESGLGPHEKSRFEEITDEQYDEIHTPSVKKVVSKRKKATPKDEEDEEDEEDEATNEEVTKPKKAPKA